MQECKFDHNNKWYMNSPVPVLENDTHKLLWDFNKQMGHLIPARRPDLIIINKKRAFAKLSTLKECEKKDKYLDLARELKKLWNTKVTIVPIVIGAFDTITKGLLYYYTICNWCTSNNPQMIDKETRRLTNKKTSRV